MKRTLLLTFICCLTLSSAYASFPVKKEKLDKIETTSENNSIEAIDATFSIDSTSDILVEEPISPAVASGDYNMWIAAALAWFLGLVAAHRWYAKKPIGWNILFILTLGGLGVWWLVDLISIFTEKFDS